MTEGARTVSLKRSILLRIGLVNLAIPLVLGTIREQIVGMWNPQLQMSLGERMLFSVRPSTIGAIVVLATVAYLLIVRRLKPLFRYLQTGERYGAARSAAIRVPWLLLLLHVGGWFVGTFVLYAFVFNWNSPGGYPFFWSLMLSLSTGMVTGIFAALAVNAILLEAKRKLNMTDIRDGEQDLFVRIKDFLILFSVIYLQTVNVMHIADFYIALGAEVPGHLSFGASAFLVTLYGALIYFAMLYLSRKEERFQRELLRNRVQELARAEGDLTQTITLINFDEIGQLAHYFNGFITGLAHIVSEVSGFAQGLTVTGEELSTEMEQTEASVEKNREHVEKIRADIQVQASNVTDSTGSVEQISKSASTLEQMITDQSSSVTESSAAVEQMVANIGSITDNLQNVTATFSKLLDASGVGKERLAFVNSQIEEVAKQSESLDRANTLISSIAAQTNLLAMNAAIEAAHAGEAGRGFAVVADEIRSLAEDAAAQSKSIKAELKKTEEVVRTVVEAAGSAEHAFDEVRTLIDRTSALESEVMAAMEEQRSGSSEVLEALTVINDITSQVHDAAEEIAQGSGSVLEEMQGLLAMTESVRENIDAISDRTGEITTVVKRVGDLSQKNQENIAGVKAQIGRFKVSE
jgi:methyl-accepting chemotaxis protein